MVENLQSKTKSSNVIAILEEERLYGHEALFKQIKWPNKCFAYLSDYVYGLNHQMIMRNYIPDVQSRYNLTNNETGIYFSFTFEHNSYELSLEGLIAMQLRFIKKMAEKQIEAEAEASDAKSIKGVVITLPLNFNTRQRQAYLNSMKLSELNLIGFVNDNDAAAFSYAYEQYKFNSKMGSDIIGIVNIGASLTQISLFNFTNKVNPGSTKKDTIINFLAQGSSVYGGRNVDYRLHQIFEKSHGQDLFPLVKISPLIEKYKEILTSNKETEYSMFGFKGKFLRAELEKELEEDVTSIKELADRLLDEALSKKEDGTSHIDEEIIESAKEVSLELIGGTTRIPCLIRTFNSLKSDYASSVNVGTHINGDDSIAKGASIIAYSMSKSAEMKSSKLLSTVKINPSVIKSESIYANVYSLTSLEPILSDYLLFDKNHQISQPTKINLSYSKNLKIEIRNHEGLIKSFHLDNIEQSTTDFNSKDMECSYSLSIEFGLNFLSEVTILNGALACDHSIYLRTNLPKFESYNDTQLQSRVSFDWTPKKVNKIEELEISKIISNLFADYNYLNLAESELKKFNTTEEMFFNRTVAALQQVGSNRPQKASSPITYKIKNFYEFDLNKDLEKLKQLDNLDDTREAKFEMRNKLEALIYEVKEMIEDSKNEYSEKRGMLNQEESDKLFAKLNDAEVWFNNEGFLASKENLDLKFKGLDDSYSSIRNRIVSIKKLNFLVDSLHTELKTRRSKINQLATAKPWIEYYLKSNVLKLIDQTEKWIKDKEDTILLKTKSGVVNEIEHLEKYENLIKDKKAAIKNELKRLSTIKNPPQPNIQKNLQITDVLRLKLSHPDDLNLKKLIDFNSAVNIGESGTVN